MSSADDRPKWSNFFKTFQFKFHVFIGSMRKSHQLFKGPYADHILIPQGSTESSLFFVIKWKPKFFLLQIQNFSFKFAVVWEIYQKVWS